VLVGLMAGTGFIVPDFVFCLLLGVVIRNAASVTGAFRMSDATVDAMGTVALSLFLVMALMTLRLWDLVGVAVPLAIMLALQVAAIAFVASTIVFRLMGRDYESAVMAGGFCGFMLGTTANAMANMEALVERHGPAPKAFLVVPMVGAFFVDFTNALIITVCLNVFS
jgi:ESS family glutamate:Na+ symporter